MVYAANAIHYGWTPSNRTWIDDAAAWAVALALLGLYWSGYRLLRDSPQRLSSRSVVLPAIPLVLISFLTIPYDSTDAFLYAAIGRAEAIHGMNPYTTVLREVPGASADLALTSVWMRRNLNPWQDLPLVYGFAFALLIKGIGWLGHGHWWLTLALLKAVNVVAYTATAAMVWSLARILGQPRPDVTLYLFAWSPLVLLHHIANAHNDILMGCLIVLAFHLVVRRQPLWAPAALLAATMIKYAALPLIPLLLVFIVRREGRTRAAAGALVMAGLAILLSLPYVQSFAAFRWDLIASQLNKTTAGSLYAFFFYLWRVLAPASLDAFGSVLKVLLWTITGLFAWRTFYRFCRSAEPSLDDLISACAGILFAILFVGSSQFYSWYIGMLFPLALLLQPQHALRQAVTLLAGTHVFSLTSLSRKGIGFFIMTTGLAAGLLVSARKRIREPRGSLPL